MSLTTRTVLIVDDDPQILRLVQRILGGREVKVLAAPRPLEALRICEGERVDLLISDMAMPEMDGNRLADKVLKLRPETSVLLISGVKDGAHTKNGRVRFLKKPFFPADLIRILGEMLPVAEKAD
uniref:Response regulator receiver protein n=1 Tax=Solibacter usitatus (strain Ellin6076) TaxID=234267 RepID=Q028V4_SOLUE